MSDRDTGATTVAPRIWLLQDGEPLPTDSNPRLMRTGTLAGKLAEAGFDVTWWTSRFHHNLKKYREGLGRVVEIAPGYRIRPLDGPPYASNFSLARVRHYRSLAARFGVEARSEPPPDLVLGSLPSPELCDAGRAFAARAGIPFIVDIRDPWPDIFQEYFPRAVRWTLWPVLRHYRARIRRIARDAKGILAVSEAMLDWGLRYAGRPRSPRDRVIYIGFPGPTQARHIDALAPFTCDHPLQCALVSSCGRSYDGALVIDAARLLHDAGNQCIRFTIIGDGEMKEAWMKRAAGLPNVEFTGFLNDDALSREMAGTHVGLIPMQGGITRFWMGNKIFEYLAGSLALASNLAGETAALIAKYDVGFSTPPGDAHALAASLARASDAPETVTKWMRNAGAAFRLHFERQTVYDTYVSYLRDIIADSRRQAAVNGTAS